MPVIAQGHQRLTRSDKSIGNHPAVFVPIECNQHNIHRNNAQENGQQNDLQIGEFNGTAQIIPNELQSAARCVDTLFK